MDEACERSRRVCHVAASGRAGCPFLSGELATARGDILRLNGVVSDVRDLVERLERKRKNLMDVLERGGYLHQKKKARIECTSGDALRKT